MQHLAGYRLADCLDDLTADQEIFVALIASEHIRIQARLAGADVPPGKHRQRAGEDSYGKLLEEHSRLKELHNEFSNDLEKCTKPL